MAESSASVLGINQTGILNLYSQAITTTTCHLAMLLAVLTIPLVILGHVTLTPQQNAKCLRSEGHT